MLFRPENCRIGCTFWLTKDSRYSLIEHGSLNVPIEHHPTIRYMVYNGYYKVMSNIPKMGQLPTLVEINKKIPSVKENDEISWALFDLGPQTACAPLAPRLSRQLLRWMGSTFTKLQPPRGGLPKVVQKGPQQVPGPVRHNPHRMSFHKCVQ